MKTKMIMTINMNLSLNLSLNLNLNISEGKILISDCPIFYIGTDFNIDSEYKPMPRRMITQCQLYPARAGVYCG
jgi:hypothetical protein